MHGNAKTLKIQWGELDPMKRGPIVATAPATRNVIGAHGGSYCVYRGLALAQGAMDRQHVPDLSQTRPISKIKPQPSWSDPKKIGCMDPFGHDIVDSFGEYLKAGFDIRPTIAVTRAHIDVPEIKYAVEAKRLVPDGKILLKTGQANITKAAVEPVWYLPEIARRFGITEQELRRSLFEETNGMYPELMTRFDLKVFMPPIGGLTIYIFGDVDAVSDPDKILTVRVHDECNGSDVFGSDICTCRPYLIHGIERCIKTAQEGGAGVIVYFRKEGRALGEVTKYLVYNLRKRQEGGDKASEYFSCTCYSSAKRENLFFILHLSLIRVTKTRTLTLEHRTGTKQVAGIEDVRFQSMMPDALHWLGITYRQLYWYVGHEIQRYREDGYQDCESYSDSQRVHS